MERGGEGADGAAVSSNAWRPQGAAAAGGTKLPLAVARPTRRDGRPPLLPLSPTCTLAAAGLWRAGAGGGSVCLGEHAAQQCGLLAQHARGCGAGDTPHVCNGGSLPACSVAVSMLVQPVLLLNPLCYFCAACTVCYSALLACLPRSLPHLCCVARYAQALLLCLHAAFLCLLCCRPGLLPGPEPAVRGACRCGGHMQHHLRPAPAGALLLLPLCALACGWCCCLPLTHSLCHPRCGLALRLCHKQDSVAQRAWSGRSHLAWPCPPACPASCAVQHQKDCKFREQLKQGACWRDSPARAAPANALQQSPIAAVWMRWYLRACSCCLQTLPMQVLL